MRTVLTNKTFLEREAFCILGLPFDRVNLDNAMSSIYDSIKADSNLFLSTPNLNFAIATQLDKEFFQSVVDSDLSVADGMPLIWIAKLLGVPLTERVAGSDLFSALSLQENKAKKIKVFFFGGQAGIAEIASHKLNESSSGMEGCGFYDPGFVSIDDMSSPAIIEQINNTCPDFLVVALGAKKGQQWIQKNRNDLNSNIISHLGAVVNFVAGQVDRAPVIWQKLGFEWLWRIYQEPVLWKRYTIDGLALLQLMVTKVLPLAIYDRILKRTRSYKLANKTKVLSKGKLISLSGSIHHGNITEFKQGLQEALLKNDDVALECSQLSYIDSAFIATLLLFQAHLSEQNRQLMLCNVSKRIKKILRLNNTLIRFKCI